MNSIKTIRKRKGEKMKRELKVSKKRQIDAHFRNIDKTKKHTLNVVIYQN